MLLICKQNPLVKMFTLYETQSKREQLSRERAGATHDVHQRVVLLPSKGADAES